MVTLRSWTDKHRVEERSQRGQRTERHRLFMFLSHSSSFRCSRSLFTALFVLPRCKQAPHYSWEQPSLFALCVFAQAVRFSSVQVAKGIKSEMNVNMTAAHHRDTIVINLGLDRCDWGPVTGISSKPGFPLE